jgi:CRP-like cAMP-binding protein
LKFVVDCSVGFPELIWAQRSVKFPLVNLVKSYEAIRYRNDRIEAQDYIWPGERYDLPTIHGEGGICVDQAYFATQAGKARGVPTLLFSGAGRDGRHAWFGYLGTGQKWVLDAGRYEEQRYVTGVTLDPQTWASLSDHELVFLSEGFRRLPPYRQSRQHQVFAELYLRLKQKPAAATAARKAVNYERRNVEAWELLVAASDEAPPRPREALLREAAQALQRYPDLNGRFVRDLATSLRERGEASAAEFEERSLVRRGQTGGRSDVGIDHAVTVMAGTAPADQVRVYRQLLQQYGRDTGIDFYDRVTAPLIEQMITAKRKGEALQVIFQTRAVLKPELGSQFDRELDELAAKAK